MSEWSLRELLSGLHEDIECRLSIARKALQHSGTKGDASEQVWLDLFKTYLPARYSVEKAHVVDSDGQFSQQIDVVIFDRQYSPLVFKHEGQIIVPAESVYAVFEAKQSVDATYVEYAKRKFESVRKLKRTSLPVPYVEGTLKAKKLFAQLGGILSFESEWTPKLGETMIKALAESDSNRHVDIACVAAHGVVTFDRDGGKHVIHSESKAATAFLLELIAMLQTLGTVPMIDTRTYAEWLLPTTSENLDLVNDA